MTNKNQTGIIQRFPFFSEFDPWMGSHPLPNLMQQAFSDIANEWPRPASPSVPQVDITETDDEYRIRAELPGVSKDDVTVELEPGSLVVRGEKKSQRDEDIERGRRLECTYGAFSRSFALPPDANAEEISAEFKDGVLSLVIQKSPGNKPKQISVKG